MKSVIALTVLLTLSFAMARHVKEAPHRIFLKDQEKHDSSRTMYILQGVRGAW